MPGLGRRIISRIIFPALFFGILFGGGCGKRYDVKYDPLLQKMASALDSANWDARCPDIGKIDIATLKTKADSALFYLLAYSDSKRSGMSLPADSLIAFAEEFYSDGNEPRRAMMASYFRACSNFDVGEYGKAVYYALRMKPFAEEMHDTLYLIRFNDILGASFRKCNNSLESARYYTDALKYYQANSNSVDGNNHYFTIAAMNQWDNAGYPDSALVVFRENAPYLLATENKENLLQLLMCFRTALRTLHSVDYVRTAKDYELLESNDTMRVLIDGYDFVSLERDYYKSMAYHPELADSLKRSLHAVGVDTANITRPPRNNLFPDGVGAMRKYIMERNEVETAKALKKRSFNIVLSCLIVLLLAAGYGLWYHRRKLRRKENEISERIDEVRLLKEDLRLRSDAAMTDKGRMQMLVDRLFSQRLKEINDLCDTYYNHRDTGERAKAVFYKEFENEMSAFGSPEMLAELEQLVDECRDGLMTRLREEIPGLKPQEYAFLTYIYAGFTARSVCVFMGISKDNYYVKRRRIKSRIADSGAPSAQRFLDGMGG